jgi:hypothetical protein
MEKVVVACPEPPKGLRNPDPIRDSHVRLAERAAAGKGLCLYLDTRTGKITLIDPSTRKIVRTGLSPQEVLALYSGWEPLQK